MSDQHSAALERAFSQQASAFEDRRFNKVFTDDVAWLFERLDLAPEQLALDVAAGTGHAARALAPFVRGVVALDATPAMLAQGKLAADRPDCAMSSSNAATPRRFPIWTIRSTSSSRASPSTTSSALPSRPRRWRVACDPAANS
jgi:hypothetical protein